MLYLFAAKYITKRRYCLDTFRAIEKSTRGEKQRQLPRRPMTTLAVVMGELLNCPGIRSLELA